MGSAISTASHRARNRRISRVRGQEAPDQGPVGFPLSRCLSSQFLAPSRVVRRPTGMM